MAITERSICECVNGRIDTGKLAGGLECIRQGRQAIAFFGSDVAVIPVLMPTGRVG
jgi:hypothetical protein